MFVKCCYPWMRTHWTIFKCFRIDSLLLAYIRSMSSKTKLHFTAVWLWRICKCSVLYISQRRFIELEKQKLFISFLQRAEWSLACVCLWVWVCMLKLQWYVDRSSRVRQLWVWRGGDGEADELYSAQQQQFAWHCAHPPTELHVKQPGSLLHTQQWGGHFSLYGSCREAKNVSDYYDCCHISTLLT